MNIWLLELAFKAIKIIECHLRIKATLADQMNKDNKFLMEYVIQITTKPVNSCYKIKDRYGWLSRSIIKIFFFIFFLFAISSFAYESYINIFLLTFKFSLQ